MFDPATAQSVVLDPAVVALLVTPVSLLFGLALAGFLYLVLKG